MTHCLSLKDDILYKFRNPCNISFAQNKKNSVWINTWCFKFRYMKDARVFNSPIFPGVQAIKRTRFIRINTEYNSNSFQKKSVVPSLLNSLFSRNILRGKFEAFLAINTKSVSIEIKIAPRRDKTVASTSCHHVVFHRKRSGQMTTALNGLSGRCDADQDSCLLRNLRGFALAIQARTSPQG